MNNAFHIIIEIMFAKIVKIVNPEALKASVNTSKSLFEPTKDMYAVFRCPRLASYRKWAEKAKMFHFHGKIFKKLRSSNSETLLYP